MRAHSAGLALGGLLAAIVLNTSAVRHSASPTTIPWVWRPSVDSVRAAIQARLDRTSAASGVPDEGLWRRVRATYAASRATPHWMVDGTLRGRAAVLLRVVGRADDHGLRRSDYRLRDLAAALEDLQHQAYRADAWARVDVALTTTLVGYANDMLTGRVDPRAIESAWHVAPRAVDVDSALHRTLRAADFESALQRLVPQEDGYATLVRAHRQYRTWAARGPWPVVEGRVALRPGDASAQVRALRTRLAAEGYLADVAPDSTPSGDRYDSPLVRAVARFQARHGLAVDSVVGPRTRAALNVGAEERARQIAANLERYRWLPPVLGDRYVVVNVPAFRLDAYEGDRRALSMRVVVGSELASRRTPIFSDSMSYVQFGPYWNVPRSIAVAEILPMARSDRGYLARNGFELVRGWGDDAPVVNPGQLSDAALFSSRYRVRQRPGPGNALGRVKFMFPNEFNVYLHDTPARALFADRVRAHSHGCVRVGDPAALARFALADAADWTDARIATTLAEGRRVRVLLPRKLPVYLVYLTAFDHDGGVAFRDDLYDLDGPLMRALRDHREAPGTEEVVTRLHRLGGSA